MGDEEGFDPFKGIVHPKMKILSSFTLSSFFQISASFFLPLNTEEGILKSVGNMEVIGYRQLLLAIFKMFFCVQREKEA